MQVSHDAILHFIFAISIIVANVLISLALCYMKNVKRTTVVFLGHLAVSNLLQGIMFTVKAIFYLWPVNNTIGCLFVQMLTVAPSGNYITGILYIYIDLYLSLRRMSIGRPIISTRLAVAMVAACWLFWLVWGAIGFAMRNPEYTYDDKVGCNIQNGAYASQYLLILCFSYITIFIAVLAFHLLTYHLIRKTSASQSNSLCQQHQTEASYGGQVNPSAACQSQEIRRKETTRKDKWLKKNRDILRMIVLVLVTFAFSWYPLVILVLVTTICQSCAANLPKGVTYMTYILVIIQYNSNGIIYLVKIKEFRNSCRTICCRCLPAFRRIQVDDADTTTMTSSA